MLRRTRGVSFKTTWEVKEIAGNIIPVITNAIIAGLIVLQALHLWRPYHLSSSASVSTSTSMSTPTSTPPNISLHTTHLQHQPFITLQPTRPGLPNPACGMCRDTRLDVCCDPGRTTLVEVANLALRRGVAQDKRWMCGGDRGRR